MWNVEVQGRGASFASNTKKIKYIGTYITRRVIFAGRTRVIY
jgi:hypothetical protein